MASSQAEVHIKKMQKRTVDMSMAERLEAVFILSPIGMFQAFAIIPIGIFYFSKYGLLVLVIALAFEVFVYKSIVYINKTNERVDEQEDSKKRINGNHSGGCGFW